ncbi:unnamed protein product [Sphacelaria rigidula]
MGCVDAAFREFDSLRIAHHTLLLRVVEFRTKDRMSYRTVSYRAVLELTNGERAETTIRKRQLWFAGALARQDETRIPKRVTHGPLAA